MTVQSPSITITVTTPPAVTAPPPTPASIALSGIFVATTAATTNTITVTGTGFTPNSLVNFGYTPIPPYANAIIAPTSSTNGSWSGTFPAPYEAGTYTMIAVDSAGVSATAQMTITAAPAATPVINPKITLSGAMLPSGPSGNSVITVSGTGFTPNVIVNFGYTPIPPYANAIIAPTTNSAGAWTGTFTAPWETGNFAMIALDANGVSATVTLVIT